MSLTIEQTALQVEHENNINIPICLGEELNRDFKPTGIQLLLDATDQTHGGVLVRMV